jgi:predicted nucleic acid-binding protein
VLAEILPFISREKERQSIHSYFNELALLPFLTEDWEEMINLRCLLNQKGISETSIPDCIIATICMKHKIPVYSKDKHFKLFSKHIPLEIY